MANLQIVIDALNNASTELGNVKTDIEGVGTAVEEVNTNSEESVDPIDVFVGALGGITAIATGVAAVISAISENMKELYEQAKLGVGIQVTADQFDNLTKSVNISSDALMTNLRDAVKGSVTDLDLMKGSALAMSLGLADTVPEITRIATVSAQLGQPMEKVALMLTNVSETSFEKLGINMDGFKGKVETLVGLGWDENIAKTEVGLQALEGQVIKVGSALDSGTIAITQQEVAVQNLTDKDNQAAAAVVSQYIPAQTEKINKQIAVKDSTISLIQATDAWSSALAAGQVNEMAYGDAMDNLTVLAREGNLTQSALAASMDALSVASGGAAGSIETLNSTELEDKELTLTVEDSEVRNYKPPDKYGVVHYAENVGRGRAVGGAVYGGNPYTWQEYGYKGELFVPSSNGFVMSRADAERALAKALTGGGAAADPDAIGRAVAKALSGVTKGNQSGNVYNLTMPTSSNPADVRTAFELMEAWA